MRFYFPALRCFNGAMVGSARCADRTPRHGVPTCKITTVPGAAGGPGSLRSEFSFYGSWVELFFSLAFSIKL